MGNQAADRDQEAVHQAPPDPGFPVQMPLVLDRTTRVLDDRKLLTGGDPLRVMRLSPDGRDALTGLLTVGASNVPDVRLLARPADQRFPVFQVETESFGKLSVEETTDYDPATQVGRGRWYISAPGNPDAWVLHLELRNIFPQELPLLLAVGGLHLRSRAEDFVQTPFDSTSRLQVCLCHAMA